MAATLFMQSSLSLDSLASNPRASNFEIIHRQDQILHVQQALAKTPEPPEDDSNQVTDVVTTGIDIVGPGNYGRKEMDDGNEVILLNDDVLTSVANATVVIIDGNDLERISVLYQFPQFLEHCPQESVNVMVPRICSEAISWSPEAQMATVEALYFVVNVKVPFRVANIIACAALRMTSDSYHPQVFDACGEIVSMILPQIHRYDVLQNVVPEAIDRAVSQNSLQRRFASRIIGSLNDALDAAELEGIFIKTALNLSFDEDESVRALIAQSMAAVGTKLPLRATESMLWPRLRDLAIDENSSVRAASIRAMAKSSFTHRLSCLSSPSFENLILPVFIEQCKRAAQVAASDLRSVPDDVYILLEIFSEVYGEFLCGLSDLLNRDALWETALGTLRVMVTCNGPTVRHWCAYNMPAVTRHCADDKCNFIKGIIQALAGDSDLETRATLAAGIHEITKSLCNSVLRNDLISATGMLFMDENAQVRMNALRHFSTILTLLSPLSTTSVVSPGSATDGVRSSGEMDLKSGKERLARDEESEEELRRLAPIFSSLELMAGDSWRTQCLLAEEVERAAHLIPQEMLCEHVAPLLFQMARESTYLVRKASMRTLVHVLRYVPDVRRRNHIFKHFKIEWAHGKVYWTRLAFIEASECAFHLFSLKLFNSMFMNEVLGLINDRVVNVRIRLVRFLKDMAYVWKDRVEYKDAVAQLAEDRDPQVSSEAHELIMCLDQFTGRSAAECEADRQKEIDEECFFVHTRHRKRKSKNRRSGIEGTIVRADELGDMESLVSNDIGLLASNGVDMTGVSIVQKGSSRGKLSVVGVESLTDVTGKGHGTKWKDEVGGPDGIAPARRESNNSALADESPTKNEVKKNGASNRARTSGPQVAVPVAPNISTETTGATRASQNNIEDRAHDENVQSGGLWKWLCGCFDGG